LTDGQLLIGVTGNVPLATTLTAGTGISIVNGSGSIIINNNYMSWVDVTGTSQTMSANRGYVADNASGVTFSLPPAAPFGTLNQIAGRGAGGWTISLSNYTVYYGIRSFTVSLSSTHARDCVALVCSNSNVEWTVLSSVGNLSYV
jgi:hypothetical protein